MTEKRKNFTIHDVKLLFQLITSQTLHQLFILETTPFP